MIIDPIEQLTAEADAELLAKYVECNDRVAIESLIVRYAPMVASVCRVTALHRNDAEDAFQATFLVLLQSARKVRKLGSIAAWLHGVAFRISSRARVRRRKHENAVGSERIAKTTEITIPDKQDDPVVLVARKMELERLVREIERLPIRLRSALVEHYLLGFTAQEIASRMEISASAVEGRLRRGRRLLRDRLVRQGISLSTALGAVGLLQQHLHAAEGTAWCHQFLNHQLNDHCLGLDCSSNSQVGALVRGELAMSMRAVAVKTSIGVALFGALGSVAALGYLADTGQGLQEGDGAENVTVVFQQPDFGGIKERSGQVILAQSPPPPQVPAQTPAGTVKDRAQPMLDMSKPGIATSATLAVQDQSKAADTSLAADKNSANAAGKAKEPEKIVPWKTPETAKPAWLEASEEEDEIVKQVERNRHLLRTRLKEGVNFPGVPLSRVVEHLSDEAQAKFYINKSALEEDGIDPDTPIVLELPPCSLRSTLGVMLSACGLTYRVSEVGIEITTLSSVENGSGTLRCYDLSFIFPSSEHANDLIKSIELSIDPDSWIINGGTATISMVGSVMVVSCPESTHTRIEDLLRSIAKMNPGNSSPSIPAAQPYSANIGGMGGGIGGMGGGGMSGGGMF